MKSIFGVTLSILIAVCLINTVVCQPDAVPADTPFTENVPAPADTPYEQHQPVDNRINLRIYNGSDCQHLSATYRVTNYQGFCQHLLDNKYFKGHCVNGTLYGLIFFEDQCLDTAVVINGQPGCNLNPLQIFPSTYGDYTCPPRLSPNPPLGAVDPGSSFVNLPSVMASVILLAAAIMVQ